MTLVVYITNVCNGVLQWKMLEIHLSSLATSPFATDKYH